MRKTSAPTMGMRSTDVWRTGKFCLPRRWLEQTPHSHVALDDALEQGSLFIDMLTESRAR